MSQEQFPFQKGSGNTKESRRCFGISQKWDLGMNTRKILAVWILEERVEFPNAFPKNSNFPGI